MFATSFFRWGYRAVLKPIYFRLDPEYIHERMLVVGASLGRIRFLRRFTSFCFEYRHPALEQEILGIHFKNPIGLAAGFDKNGKLADILPSVGFGFEEIGSITGEPCAGNPKKRLWRLPNLRGLVVNYGLPNEGAQVIASKLKGKQFRFPIGISLAKTNCQACAVTETGIRDYRKGLEAFIGIGDYYTINVSCPNAYGGQPFQDSASLDALMTELDTVGGSKPVFIKVSADTSLEEIPRMIEVASKHRVQGFIISNLTKQYDQSGIADEMEKRGIETGGISGKPTEELSNRLLEAFYRAGGKGFVLIGCGGIFSAEDVYRKIKLGASLVQLITGMIYEGPQLIGELNKDLVQLLKKDGFEHVSQAVGTGLKQ
jgi:dihydroorotate dehydrogenase